MTTKWEIQSAVLGSELPKLGRLVMLVLLARADAKTAVIPAAHTPSLTVLAGQCGMDRSTVERTLRHLETAGWIARQRPPVERSRRGERTRYRLTLPVGAEDTYVGAEDTQGGCACHLGVGAGNRKPRCRLHPVLDPYRGEVESDPRAPARVDETIVIRELFRRTGKTIPRDHAALVIRQLVNGRTDIRDRSRYLSAAIRNDNTPARFLPTPTPPTYEPER